MLASSTCWYWWWSSVHDCRLSRVPLLCMFHCVQLVKWLHGSIVDMSSMIFIVDASGHARFQWVVLYLWYSCTSCSVGYDSLMIWSIVMLYPHAYVDIMLMHCNCIMLFYHGSTYLHSSLTGLNWTWTTVGWVIVPLNRCWPVQPRLPVWDGPNWVYCRASRRCLQRGKVMGVRYPGPVSRHNLVCPLLLLWIRSPWGTFWAWRWSLCLW